MPSAIENRDFIEDVTDDYSGISNEEMIAERFSTALMFKSQTLKKFKPKTMKK